MATIKSKQTFTMRNGEIRIPWRSTVTVPDEDVITFITSDSVYSKNGKWRTVFDILSFDDAENERKFLKNVSTGNTFSINKSSVDNADTVVASFSDNGRIDKRSVEYKDRIVKINNEFLILNDKERNDALAFISDSNDVETLYVLKNLLQGRGDKRWVAEIDSILTAIEIRKADEASLTAMQEMQDARKNN
jgi:hypothetical protein